MTIKYDIDIPNSVIKADVQRLINQLWKLIPMRENQEDWESHLKILIEEIAGLNELTSNQLQLLILLSKLEGLAVDPDCLDFMFYRKTVFKCIDLLAKVVPLNE